MPKIQSNNQTPTPPKPQLKNFGERISESGKKLPVYRPADQIIDDLKKAAQIGLAPLISVHGALYGVRDFEGVPSNEDLLPLTGSDAFQAWLPYHYDLVWTGAEVHHANFGGQKVRPVSFGPVIKGLQHHLPSHEGLEFMPHYPSVPKHHYLRPEDTYSAGDGSHFEELISKLNPDTEQDRDLLRAFFLTPAWGGPPGARPLFMLTSDHGRGVGKSTTAEILGHLYGGLTMLDAGRENAQSLARKLGSPGEVSKRLILIDNVKKRQSSATYEAMVTARELAADRLYQGAFQPPNLKTWVMTLNSGDASTDIASRSVVIKIGRAPWGQASPTFKADIYRYIDEHREEILSDILTILRSQPKHRLDDSLTERWKAWETQVLAHFGGDDLLRLLIDRRQAIDTEADEAADLIGVFRTILTGAGIDPGVNVCIPTEEIIPPLREFWENPRIGYRGRDGVWNLLKSFYVSKAFRDHGVKKGMSSSRAQRGLEWRPDPLSGVLDWEEAKKLAGSNVIGFPISSDPDPEPPTSSDPGLSGKDLRKLYKSFE